MSYRNHSHNDSHNDTRHDTTAKTTEKDTRGRDLCWMHRWYWPQASGLRQRPIPGGYHVQRRTALFLQMRGYRGVRSIVAWYRCGGTKHHQSALSTAVWPTPNWSGDRCQSCQRETTCNITYSSKCCSCVRFDHGIQSQYIQPDAGRDRSSARNIAGYFAWRYYVDDEGVRRVGASCTHNGRRNVVEICFLYYTTPNWMTLWPAWWRGKPRPSFKMQEQLATVFWYVQGFSLWTIWSFYAPSKLTCIDMHWPATDLQNIATSHLGR